MEVTRTFPRCRAWDSVLGVSSEVSFRDSLTLLCIPREVADPLWASQFTLWLMGTACPSVCGCNLGFSVVQNKKLRLG